MTFGFGFGFPRMQGVAAAFSPASLFAAGEVGAWYDPSDLTTLFTDTAGTTPVTTPGQTVALMLDKSRGLVLGPELVTNGDFAAGSTGWSVGSPEWSIGAGVATYSGSVNANLSTSASIVVAGRWYEVQFSVVSGSGVTIAPYLINQASPLAAASFVNIGVGSYRCILLAPSNGSVVFRRQGGSVFSIDNISVREIPGNHATQATTLSRPTYAIEPMTGRRNLLTFTEQFDNVVWQKQSFGFISADVALAPNDTLTADKLILTNAQTATPQVSQNFSAVSGQQYALQLCAKAAEISDIVLIGGGAASGAGVRVDLLTGNIVQTFAAGSLVSSSTTSLGDGWWRIRIVVTANATGTGTQLVRATNTAGSAFLGNGVDGILIWGAQLELGSTATPYQRVTTQFDVTEAGVASKSYLFFDGSDDFMLTGTITPGSVDKAQVFAGVRKLSDAATAVIAEYSANSGVTAGTWGLFSGGFSGGAAAYAANLNGSQRTSFDATTFTAPISSVLTSTFDIAGAARANEIGVMVNGVIPTLTGGGNANAGTGNFSAQVVYIGRKAGTSAPFSGNIYGLITRFSATNLDAATITSTETWMNSKTGAF